MYIIFDKSAAPTASFINQGDANYQHGFRIFANGMPQSEKTALYIVPSQLNNDNMRYGVTYLPGIGITQALWRNMPQGSAIDGYEYLLLNLPAGGVQWTDDMPTEWYIKDSEGWQDLGLLNYMLRFGTSEFQVITDLNGLDSEIDLDVLNPLSVPVDRLAYLKPKEPYGKFPISIYNDTDQYLFSFCDGDIIIIDENAFDNNTGTAGVFDITTIPDTHYSDGYWPFLLFEKMFTIEA